MGLVLLAQIVTTLFMTGVIWFAQIVHYPLLGTVGTDSFSEYQDLNMRRTGWVVGPPMIVEGFCAVLLAWFRPEGIPVVQVWTGIGLLAVIWLSTAMFQVPRHKILALGFNRQAHRILVISNWIRTAAWSLRGGLVLWMAYGYWNVCG